MPALPQGESQKTPQSTPPPKAPAGYTVCDKVHAEATVIGPHQAKNKGAISHKAPQRGDVAIRPRDFGVAYPGTTAGNTAGQQTMQEADITIYPDWSTATDAKTGAPTGPPPGAPKGPYKAVDVMNPPTVRNDPNRPTSIDIYRSNKDSATKVDIWVVMKPNPNIGCPK